MNVGTGRLGLCAGVLMAVSAGAAAQSPSGEHASVSVRSPTDSGAILEQAVMLLGESPLAALLEAAGEDARRIHQHVVTLADPFFEGRVPGSRGHALAADYIEHYLRQAGLTPLFPEELASVDGTGVLQPRASFRQRFRAGTEVRVARGALTIPGAAAGLEHGRDYTVLGCSGSGHATGPLVFVGYSIVDGPEGYSSYPQGHASLKGKIAIVLRFEPVDESGRSRWAAEGWSPAADLMRKVSAAVERGAAGVIVVNPPGVADPRSTRLVATEESRGPDVGVPVVMLRADLAEQMIRLADSADANRALVDFRRAADQVGGVVDLPNAQATLDVQMSRQPVVVENVGGLIAGSGPLSDQFIVIGAHYDHVGRGPAGVRAEHLGQVHPGADDNASGTASVLVLADRLARWRQALSPDASVRGIVLVAFSGEEWGLLGSRHFVEHCPVPRERIFMMINLDMVGRLRADPPLEVEGLSTGQGLADWAGPILERYGLPVRGSPAVSGNSDHASFYRHDIPVLFFFTGFHRDYHRPGDEAWKVNVLGVARIVGVIQEIVQTGATREQAMAFVAAPARERTSPGPMRVRVRFGIAPGNYGDADRGILVGDVYEGTSAHEAGIRPGDRLIRWNDTPLHDVESWMSLLAGASPGEVVQVTLIRDGREVVVPVRLKAAAPRGN